MERAEIKIKLLEAINENLDTDGWSNMLFLGRALKEKGIDFKDLGYDKLFQLIKDYRDCIVWKVDDKTNPGFLIIHVREKSQFEKNKYQRLASIDKDVEIDFSANPKNALSRWASFGDFNETINVLNDLSLPERWYYQNQNPKFLYPILAKYLKYTFYRLTQENGKILENDSFAAFNTGLVDRRYEPIYAFFEKTPNSIRKYRLINFCIAGEEQEGKDLIRQFKDKPERAHYFDNVNDMIYDTRASSPECDWNHIIVENISRLPQTFIKDNRPKDFSIQSLDELSFDEKKEYFSELAKAIENDNKAYRNITFRLKDALDLALKRINWNFKTAIPQYYPTINKMSLLLPLALLDDEIVDIALVVEKTQSGNYLGHTILPLEWAYSNARLVCRPDSDWLVADRIEPELDEDHIIELEK